LSFESFTRALIMLWLSPVISYEKRLASIFITSVAVLFGSVARGESERESDADILIITSKSNALIKDEISLEKVEEVQKRTKDHLGVKAVKFLI